jgi:cytochrome c oxidase assembly protein subunit 15
MPNHFNEWIHMLHRFFAIFGGTWLMFLAWQLRTSSSLRGIRHVGSAILLLIPLEVSVGIVNALYRIPVPVSALHTAVAATLVGLIAYALSESVLLSSESEYASTEHLTARPARTGVAA